MNEIIIAIIILIVGLIFIIFSSQIAVKHSAALASALGVSPLIIGVTLVSIGTDLSEIMNSIISCSLGHGDIDVGDSIESNLTQITLVFGLLPIVCGSFHVERKTAIILGSCEILALITVFSVVEKGYFTRLNALFMVGSLVIYFWIIYNANKDSMVDREKLIEITRVHKSKKFHLMAAILGFIGVTISSYAIIQSVITLSALLNVHEYIISFFILSIGTSLPELAVDINALRAREHNIAFGDIIGSCIVDATLSIGIGQVFFPQAVTAELAIPTILYTIFASFLVITIVAVRGKVDKKADIVFILIYLSSFSLLLFM